MATPTNPTGTTSATGVMMGLGATCKITPVYSGRLRIEIIGSLSNNAANENTTAKLFFGTGTPPTNGAPITGTNTGVSQEATITVATAEIPYSVPAIVTGLSPGTTNWFDIDILMNNGTGSALGNTCNAMEF